MRRRICGRFISFNTQPPEGGWVPSLPITPWSSMFQHSAARRRLGTISAHNTLVFNVSTLSRPKAAGYAPITADSCCLVSTLSRPKAAGAWLRNLKFRQPVSTLSRPKAAGFKYGANRTYSLWFQHSAARRRLAKHCFILHKRF